MRTALTDDQLDRMAEMRERGLGYARIAEILNVSQDAVEWQCLRLGALPPPERRYSPNRRSPVYQRGNVTVRAYTPFEDARLLALAPVVTSRAEIARRLGRSRNSVVGRLLTLARRDAMDEAA